MSTWSFMYWIWSHKLVDLIYIAETWSVMGKQFLRHRPNGFVTILLDPSPPISFNWIEILLISIPAIGSICGDETPPPSAPSVKPRKPFILQNSPKSSDSLNGNSTSKSKSIIITIDTIWNIFSEIYNHDFNLQMKTTYLFTNHKIRWINIKHTFNLLIASYKSLLSQPILKWSLNS